MAHTPPQTDTPRPQVIQESLRHVFGFESFRPNQQSIIEAILSGRDVFAVMPTGGGKSLCYQLPARILPGTAVVISPLISLMKDQVDAARDTGLDAAYLNSSLDPRERAAVLRQMVHGQLDLLYIAPERFAMESFLDTLKKVNVCLVAVDEAHCISEWGHDFRPDYLLLSHIIEHFPAVPVAAFTATATARVQRDIVAKLGLRAPFMLRASFDRPNLFYEVLPKRRPDSQILAFVRANRGKSGVVYRTTRKSVESTAEMLQASGIRARPYHAGLETAGRDANQEAFNRDEIDVIVATIAFGMGIDKSNIRYIIHGDLPKNMESYYQETGRAGRDGDPAHCLLLYGAGDIPKIRYFIDRVEDEAERQRLNAALRVMASYGSTHACRRRQILGYFGEEYPRPQCDACDVCTKDVEKEDATREAQMLLSAIARTGQRFGANHIVDIVAGADTQRMHELGHNRLPTYGVGKGRAKEYWKTLLSTLETRRVVIRTDDTYPRLTLTEEAGRILRGEEKFHILAPKSPLPAEAPAQGKKRRRIPAPATQASEDSLFERLRAVRFAIARSRHIPPYIVFTDRTLHDMALRKPATEMEMLGVVGVGDAKLERYGAEFLREIRSYLGRAESGPDAPSPYRNPFGDDSGDDQPFTPPPPANHMQKAREQHPRAYDKWDTEEDERLRADYLSGKTIAELILTHKRNPGSIRSRLRKLGLE